MVKMAGKRALMETLVAEGVEYIFGNPGTSESPIMSSLGEYPALKYVLATQEGVAMGMADGYALATGKPAFVNLHIDTGLANGISLLHHAFGEGRDTPMIVTSGNKDIRKLAEGRTELTDMTRPFTKWSAEVTHPEQMPAVLRRAFTEAKTPPTGPVYVGFAANALDDEAEMKIQSSSSVYSKIAPDSAGISAAVAALAKSRRPILIAGDRLARSKGPAAAAHLAELIGARVYSASYAEMNFPTSHPQYMGRINLGLPAGREILATSDLVIAVGTNVFEGFFYFSESNMAAGTRLIHIDSAPREVGKSEITDIGIISDPKIALEQINQILEDSISGTAREAAKERSGLAETEKSKLKSLWDKNLKEHRNNRPMPAARMMHELATVLPSNAIIVDDSITCRDDLHAAMDFNEPGSIYASSNFGAIGWGMGGTLGVKLAHADRPVIGIVGDGSAMMTIQALWTAANYNIPAVYVICNNASYRILKLNMARYKQYVLGQEPTADNYIGMDFPQPFDMAAIANALGVSGHRIENPEELGLSLNRAIDSGKPALLDVIIDGAIK